jgi:hypothetical protein
MRTFVLGVLLTVLQMMWYEFLSSVRRRTTGDEGEAIGAFYRRAR